MPEGLTVADRIRALFDHLGLDRVFIATQMPGDLAGLCRAAPDRIAGMVLVVASRVDPGPLAPLGDRVLVLAGDSGIPCAAADAAAPGMPAARQVRFPDYISTAWSDIAVERADALCETVTGFLGGLAAPAPVTLSGSGTVAEITYRIAGSGPPLILPPYYLAASQWEPVIERFARDYTVIVLGGAHIGGVAMLEDRADLASYRDLFSAVIRRMAIPGEASVLEVGCGPTALCRQLLEARPDITLTGLDANAYLLREGAVLSRAAGVTLVDHEDAAAHPGPGGLKLIEGNAIALPFPDASFDAVYSITVLEECDADAALAELARVVRPGGPVGVAVRAIDMWQWWNIDLPDAIAAKVNLQPQSVSPGAVADRSLYARMATAGFTGIQGFPQLLTFDRPEGPIWSYREAHARGQLTDDERVVWDAARTKAADNGLLFQANPIHCAVGWRPVG